MPLYGQAGAGASGALLEILAQQFRERMMQQESQQRQQRIDLDSRQFDDQMRLQRDKLAADEADRKGGIAREEANFQRGVMLKSDADFREREAAEGKARTITDLLQRVPAGAPRLSAELEAAGIEMSPEQVATPEERAASEAANLKRVGDLAAAQRRPAPTGGGAAPTQTPAPRPQPASTRSEYSLDHSRDVVRKVDDILPRINNRTAGAGGALIAKLPINSAARDVDADLHSLAANLAFDQLQRMREASKTGGALGQVAVAELELLKNAEASIRQNQSPANLRKNLQIIRESAQRYLDVAGQGGNIEPMAPMSSHGDGTATAPDASVVEYVRDPKTGRLVRK